MVDDGDLVVISTSGTTGEPKGVVLTYDAVVASAIATSSRLGVSAEHDHWLCALPLNHVGGLSVVMRSFITGTRLTLFDRFDIARFEQAISDGATLTSLVPTTLARLGRKRSDRFRKILLGGSSMPPELPGNVVTTYGMTETGSGVVYDGMPLDDVEIEIRSGGEIALRCPMLLRCYRDGTDPKDERGFFGTGDIGAVDVTDRLQVFGRNNELIISGGENIWPVEVERLLTGVPGVAEIGIAGIEDSEWGQRIVGVVVTTPDAVLSLDALNERCRAHIGPWAVLKDLIVVEALPRTAIGKLDRRQLTRLATAGL
jgi:O-succinylbenzoic acid--CoA ligase